MLPHLTALIVLFWRWNGVGSLCFEGDNFKKKKVNFFQEKSASGWPGSRIFWPQNDLAPSPHSHRHCSADLCHRECGLNPKSRSRLWIRVPSKIQWDFLLSKEMSVIKFSWRSDRFVQTYEPTCGNAQSCNAGARFSKKS